MTFHSAYGITIGSDCALPELPRADPPARYHVRWSLSEPPPANSRWSVIWRTPSGEPWVTTARAEGARYFLFRRYMAVLERGAGIQVRRLGFTASHTLRHLFLDQALPLILAGSGHIVLHASAVRVAGRAVLLAGATGAGKSTLAAQLHRLGADVLADDGALIQERDGRLEAAPSYPGLRLFDDAATVAGFDNAPAMPVAGYSAKRRFEVGTRVEAPLPLGLMYVLDEELGATAFVRLSRRDAVMAVLRHAYRAELDGAGHVQTQLDRVTGWADRLRVWRLVRPRQLQTSESVAAAVLSHATEVLGTGQS